MLEMASSKTTVPLANPRTMTYSVRELIAKYLSKQAKVTKSRKMTRFSKTALSKAAILLFRVITVT